MHEGSSHDGLVGIARVHWGTVLPVAQVRALSACAVVWALWPEPVDADACFERAGFTAFGDFADDRFIHAWERDWRALLGRVLAALESHGPPITRVQAQVAVCDESASWWRRMLGGCVPGLRPWRAVSLGVVAQLELVTSDDQFGEVHVTFGQPPRVHLLAGGGHPLMWVGWEQTAVDAAAWLSSIAGGVPVVRTELRWDCLLGDAGRESAYD